MNEDIVPGLLATIEDDFKKSFQSDDTLKTLYGKVQDGTATQADGEKFSHELGRLTAEVFHRNVTPEILPDGTLYYNIANRIIPPILGNNHGIVCEVMKQVIERMNHDAGLGIKFQEPEFEFRRVHDLVWKASLDKYEKTQKMVETGMDTFTRSVADDCVRTNAEFQYEAGLSPRIERDTDGDCCSWCSDMAGTYDYKSAPKEVFARHANCGCTVEFLPGDGRRQNVHTKDWTSETESAMINSSRTDDDRSPEKIEARKLFSHAVFRTGGNMTAREYAQKQKEIDDVAGIPRIRLSKKEYAMVVSALDTYIYNGRTPEREKRGVIHKEVKDHIYTVVNYGFGHYEIIGREELE